MYEKRNASNSMSMINKTTDLYNKIECMFLNVPNKVQSSTVVFMKVSRSEHISHSEVDEWTGDEC